MLLFSLLWLVVVGAPVYYMTVVSLKPSSHFLSTNPWLPSGGLTFDNYAAVWQTGLARYLLNSMVISVGTTLLAVVIGFFAAYAIVVRASRVTGLSS